jgi:hypothetical protein
VNGDWQERLKAGFSVGMLDRVLMRVRADLPFVKETIGTGAPITLKRATAVRMALEGASGAEIAGAVGLNEARVGQVLENAIASGPAALYPAFDEIVSLPEGMSEAQLWEILHPLMRSTPPSHGVKTAAWTPVLLAEYLVHEGTLEDASSKQIGEMIHRLGRSEEQSPGYSASDKDDPSQKERWWGPSLGLLMASVMLGFLVASKSFSIPAYLILGLVFLLFLLMAIKQLQEQWLKLAIRRKNKEVWAVKALAERPTVTVNHGWALPKVSIVHALGLPETGWKTDGMTDAANAMGRTPARVLYLWVFAAQEDQRGFETEGWPQIGPVHLLLNTKALTINQLARGVKNLYVQDEAMLTRAIGGYADAPGDFKRPELFALVSTGAQAKYRGYPIHTLVCVDGVWQAAFHQLAERCEVAVVNLSGYNPIHPGLEYEMRHLLSGGGPRRFVFLYAPTTDADGAIESVLGIWQRLDVPTASVEELIFVRVPASQDVGYNLQFQTAVRGTGWLANIHMGREGEYVPVAGRILGYLEASAL